MAGNGDEFAKSRAKSITTPPWSKTLYITIAFKDSIKKSYLKSENRFLAFTKSAMAWDGDEFAKLRTKSITTLL